MSQPTNILTLLSLTKRMSSTAAAPLILLLFLMLYCIPSFNVSLRSLLNFNILFLPSCLVIWFLIEAYCQMVVLLMT